MQRLDPTPTNDLDAFISQTQHRLEPARTVLTNLSETIRVAYASYLGNLPSALPPALALTTAQSTALRRNYDSTRRGGSLSWLREELMTNVPLGRCPYCDSAQATTLDHYLPLESYPEYSILSANLVPACFRCNNARGLVLSNPNGTLLWHAYLDVLPSERVLFAELLPDETRVTARFSIRNPNGVDPDVVAKLSLLFDALNLANYFAAEAAVLFYDDAPGLSRLWGAGGDNAVSRELKQRAADWERRHGRNTWSAALYAALAEVPTFAPPRFNDLVRADEV